MAGFGKKRTGAGRKRPGEYKVFTREPPREVGFFFLSVWRRFGQRFPVLFSQPKRLAADSGDPYDL
jgi:hypothetical protein